MENDRNKFVPPRQSRFWRKVEGRRASVEKLPGLFSARLRSGWQRYRVKSFKFADVDRRRILHGESVTPFDKFRSLFLSLSLLFSTVDIRSRARRTNSTMRLLRVYYPIYAPVSGRCGGCACNGHRGKINCCPRAFNHGLDLFISTFLPLPRPKVSRGLFTLGIFSITLPGQEHRI